MPSNNDFALKILVGDTVLPEYEKDDIYYVESNFFTPYSFKQQSEETVNGEIEIQSWPVTPFYIQIETNLDCGSCYFRFYVDGQKVSSKSVQAGTKRVVKGFRDGTLVREFLFSLPRFAKNEHDRIDNELSNKVGLIEVECCYATLRTTQMRVRNKKLQYDQANKKDCNRVTAGSYLMSTTKAGRVVGMKNSFRNVDFWDVHTVTSSLSVKYVTAQTLQDMQIEVIPIPFPANARSNSSSSSGLRPNIIRKRPHKSKTLSQSKVKTEINDNVAGISSANTGHVRGSSLLNQDNVTGSFADSKPVLDVDHANQVKDSDNDHVYSGGLDYCKEEVVNSTYVDGETIDLTLEEDCDEHIEIID